MKPAYQIIYINGPSSSGKTALAHALQNSFIDPYLHVSLDKIIGMMPNKLNNWEGGYAPEGFWWKEGIDKEGQLTQEIQMGPFAKKMVLSLKEIALTLAKMGHYLIIDDVAFGASEVALWQETLQNYRVLWIGLNAPLEHLELREKARGDRIAGSARAQHKEVHNGITYDLEFNTHQEPQEAIVRAIKSKVYPSAAGV